LISKQSRLKAGHLESAMQKKYLIGVDLGTSSTKSALFTINGKKIAEFSVSVPIYYRKLELLTKCSGFL
jgi:ribulose kinase